MKISAPDQVELTTDLLRHGKSIRKTASGQSMLPTIPDGAILEIHPLSGEQAKPGDIIYFISKHGSPLIHRLAILYKKQNAVYFQAWGDNNPFPDNPVPIDHILGRVISFKHNGKSIPLHRSFPSFLKYFLLRYSWYYSIRLLLKLQKVLSTLIRSS